MVLVSKITGKNSIKKMTVTFEKQVTVIFSFPNGSLYGFRFLFKNHAPKLKKKMPA